MKVLFLTEGERVQSTRFRVLPYLPHLEAAGIEPALAHSRPAKYYLSGCRLWDHAWWHYVYDNAVIRLPTLVDRRRAVARAREADAVFLQRDLTRFRKTPDLEERLAAINPRIVFDFDDAIYLRTDGREDPAAAAKIRRIVELARRVTAGNRALRDWAGGGDRVTLLPTPVDTDRFAPAPRPPGGPVRLGWIGVRYNLPYLRLIEGPLARVTRSRDAVVRIVCERPPDPSSFPFRAETVPWSEEREAELLQSFDAGLMPMPDTPWTRGKCGLKLLQYMAAGIPSAASPVGVNAEMLAGGACGLLPDGEAAWEEALDRLAADASYRASAGRAARARAEAEYSVRRWAPELARVLKEAASG